MLALPLHLKKAPNGTMALTDAQLEKKECSGGIMTALYNGTYPCSPLPFPLS